jgi:ATP-binding cassette subfamily F protein uup
MDNVVTSIMAFEGNNSVNEYVGGYTDWTNNGGNINEVPIKQISKSSELLAPPKSTNSKPDKKRGNCSAKAISQKKKKQISAMLKHIDQLESAQSEIERLMSNADFYGQTPEDVEKILKKSASISTDLEKAFSEWENLEQ